MSYLDWLNPSERPVVANQAIYQLNANTAP